MITRRQKMVSDLVTSVVLMVFFVGSSGCAAMMAAKQPDYTDLSVLRQGTRRSVVISEFGRPFRSKKSERGNLVETYEFKQGYKTGTKGVRVLFHVVADVMTLFLWEIIGMPMEMVFDGNKITVDATFDKEDRLMESTVIEK